VSLVSILGLAPALLAEVVVESPDSGIEHRLATDFPAMARLASIDAARAAISEAPLLLNGSVEGFLSSAFADGYRLRNGSAMVVLRPERPQSATSEEGRSGRSYRRAFEDIDAFRAGPEAGAMEIFLLTQARQLESIAYRVTVAQDVSEIVNSGRGIRFVSRTGPDLVLSAPLIIDSVGRPSLGARWAIDRSDRGSIATLRLQVRDARVRYPIALAYAPGRATIPLGRLRVIANAIGAIAGTVTAFGGGAIANAAVYVFDSGGEFVDFATTDSNGNYTVGGLGTGNFFAVSFADGFVAQAYNGLACPDFTCSPLNGNAIAVTDGVTTGGINFALHSTSAIVTGTVTGPGPSPLTGVTVVLYNGAGSPSGSAITDVNGQYRVSSPSGGTFFARTFNNVYPGLVDSLYSGMNCTGCNPTSGTSFSAPVGSVTGNINFSLVNGGRIAGKLTDAFDSAPLELRRVTIYNSAGTPVSFADSDAGGNYVSFNGLVSGNYYVLASAAGYFSQLYNGIDCTGCPITGGTAISVTLGSTTSNINFAMHSSQAVASGKVTDAATGGALGGVTIVFFNTAGKQIVATTSDFATGSYSVNLPAAGRYFARSENGLQQQYLNQLYMSIDCSGCPPTGGTPIDITLGVPSTNINFALNKSGGKITGSILDAGTSAPIPLAFVQVLSASGDVAAYGYADTTGQYAVVDGLATGSYFVIARAPGYVPVLYSAIPCTTGCVITSGTALQVTKGQTTANINFGLSSTAIVIIGHVRAAATNTALSGIEVAIYDPTDSQVGSGTSDSGGNYSVSLPTGGTFFARTQNTVAPQYHDQLWDHLPCENCDPLTGTAIHVADGATLSNINFDLTTTTCPTIDVSPSSLPSASVGDSYSQTITASNGTAPIGFSVSAGTLPPGLSLTSGGLLSGSLTTSGSFSFTVIATDANGCAGSHGYTINVSAAATSTVLVANPSAAVFGTTVKLTASVSPATATGNASFFDGATLLGTAVLSGGSAFINVASFTAGTHNVSAVYNGSASFAPSTSPTIVVTIDKATPVITWPPPGSITYGTPLSATQLNATANVPGSFVYFPPAGTILNAGTQLLTVNFTPADTANYKPASATTSLVVNKADQQINWSNPADIVYGTPLSATQLNATVTVPGPSPAGALTYNPAAGVVLNAGVNTLSVTAAATANYNQATASVTINVLKATPTFSNLSAPVIVIGTATTTVTGTISFGTFIPTGVVIVTVEGATQSAAIQADGSFEASFATGSLSIGLHPIAFSYPGDANFNPATGSSTLTVAFGIRGGSEKPGPANSGSTIPFAIQIIDANGANLSSEDIVVTAFGVQLVGSMTWLPAVPPGNQGLDFMFQNGGRYRFNLTTEGLASGQYVLGFTVSGDPTIHTVPFEIK